MHRCHRQFPRRARPWRRAFAAERRTIKRRLPTLIFCYLLAACGGASPGDGQQLPALNALPEFTVSGLSAGAYLAGQLHVAFSSEIRGAGLVAGGPWGCARGSLQRALGPCVSGAGLQLAELTRAATSLAAEQEVEPLSGLAGDRIFIFHGSRDAVVAGRLSDMAAAFYQEVAPNAVVAVEKRVPAAHGWPTQANGAPCGEFVEPWINACGYDLAGEMLASLLGPLNEPVEVTTELVRFRQSSSHVPGMAEEGLLFVPPRCRDGLRCRVHVFLHGCRQAEGQIGTRLAAESGLLRWAASNDLVVLFPQAEASIISPMNALACWDWWGYSGEDYLTRSALQLQAIRRMVRRLQEAP